MTYRERKMWSPNELAKELGVDKETVRRWLRNGHIRGVKPGGRLGHWLIPNSEIERLLAEKEYFDAGH